LADANRKEAKQQGVLRLASSFQGQGAFRDSCFSSNVDHEPSFATLAFLQELALTQGALTSKSNCWRLHTCRGGSYWNHSWLQETNNTHGHVGNGSYQKKETGRSRKEWLSELIIVTGAADGSSVSFQV